VAIKKKQDALGLLALHWIFRRMKESFFTDSFGHYPISIATRQIDPLTIVE
jgi:hypothetical protein